MSDGPFRRLFRLDRSRAGIDRAVDDELRFHFEMSLEELMAHGLPPDEARREAERRFGDVPGTRARLSRIDRDRVEHDRRREWWSALAQDLRYGLRGMRRSPWFAAAVVITLGVGIGANATMFGIVDRLLLRPPAFLQAPGRVHRLYMARTIDGKPLYNGSLQYRRFRDIAQWSTAFDRVLTYWDSKTVVGRGADTRELTVGSSNAALWSMFDVRPVLGRFFTDAEDRPPSGTKVAVLSEAYWRSRYGARRDVLGSAMWIGASAYTIIGVAPHGFAGMSLETPVAFVPITAVASDAIAPMVQESRPWYDTYHISFLRIYARRKPGVSARAAEADLTTTLRRSYLAQADEQPAIVPIERALPRGIVSAVQDARGPEPGSGPKVAVWLLGVAGVVLLIACANVANLLLARALRRRREIAVRVALGVGRARLLRQLLAESVLLALLGGVAGALIAQWGGAVLRAVLLPQVEWTSTITDVRVLLFSAVVALGAGLLCGLAPALHAVRADVADALKAGQREGTLRRSVLRTGLTVAQASLSVVLLVGAGLFVRSLQRVTTVHLGYEADHLLWVSPEMRGVQLDSTGAEQLRERMLERAQSLPEVASAARGVTVPFFFSWDVDLFVQGIDSVARLGTFTLQAVSPEYFTTMGTRILAGRGIGPEDRAGAPRAMVVSEAMARTLWPHESPLGKCVRVNADTVPCAYVVGVAENIKRSSLGDDPGLHYYLAIRQFALGAGGIFVRTRGPAERAAESVRRALQREMPGAAYAKSTTLSSLIDGERRSWQLGAVLFAVFGGLALLLAGVGLYSVIAYAVTQRTHEMGVRTALGARATDVVRLVLGEGMRVAVIGLVLGAGIALVAARWIAPLLFEEPPRDPLVYAGVIVVLLAVAALASWIPARRAARVDPSAALRTE
ncbi:MAG TPA: ADOP family duplicated permease [Gemmatimonadaceae bacterium]|nr:ADOP family duplicated permease [Gemmatimonadaceae bacterium]